VKEDKPSAIRTDVTSENAELYGPGFAKQKLAGRRLVLNLALVVRISVSASYMSAPVQQRCRAAKMICFSLMLSLQAVTREPKVVGMAVRSCVPYSPNIAALLPFALSVVDRHFVVKDDTRQSVSLLFSFFFFSFFGS
jgi:hypothetical protein